MLVLTEQTQSKQKSLNNMKQRVTKGTELSKTSLLTRHPQYDFLTTKYRT